MYRYTYNGPVYEFDKLIASNWNGETCAPSEARARTNLAYQFKKQNNRSPRTKITVPGELKKI